MNVRPFGRTSARIITPEGREALTDLPVPAVRKCFTEAGLLLFRGFPGGAGPFKAFADLFVGRYLRDLGGSKSIDAVGDYMQSVMPVGNAQDLHCESARGPNPPDLLWFHCITPARTGGETTFADGVEIWTQLSAATRSLFSSKRVSFVEVLPDVQWRVGLRLLFFAELDHINLAGTTFKFLGDGTMRMEFVTSAVRRTRWTGAESFTNSLTGPYPGPARFEDGTEIPQAVMAEIKAVHARVIDQVAWEASDLLMVDNSRFMHGRREFADQQREHLTCMGMANFDGAVRAAAGGIQWRVG
ncbi:MAG: TauD/TfdA family dioxygenase [Acidobacteriota bacterium]